MLSECQNVICTIMVYCLKPWLYNQHIDIYHRLSSCPLKYNWMTRSLSPVVSWIFICISRALLSRRWLLCPSLPKDCQSSLEIHPGPCLCRHKRTFLRLRWHTSFLKSWLVQKLSCGICLLMCMVEWWKIHEWKAWLGMVPLLWFQVTFLFAWGIIL